MVCAVTLSLPYLERNRYNIRADHEALRWTPTTTEETRKLSRCRLRLSEFEFDIVPSAGMKQKAVDALLSLTTKGDNKTALVDDIPVLTVSQAFCACAPRTEIIDSDFIEEAKRSFFHFTPDICILADITENEKAEM